jgi:hypothetical protein
MRSARLLVSLDRISYAVSWGQRAGQTAGPASGGELGTKCPGAGFGHLFLSTMAPVLAYFP